MADVQASSVPVAAVAASPKKVKKPSTAKPKTESTHPKTSDMVHGALASLNEKNGSSLIAIKKFMAANYTVDTVRLAPYIRNYLKKAVESGAVIQTKGSGATGSFKLPAKTAPATKKAKVAKDESVKEKKPKKMKAAKEKNPKKATTKKDAAKGEKKVVKEKTKPKKEAAAAAVEKKAVKKSPVKKAPAGEKKEKVKKTVAESKKAVAVKEKATKKAKSPTKTKPEKKPKAASKKAK